MLIEDPYFLKAKISLNNARARHFFGNTFSNSWLKAAKDSIMQRIELMAAEHRGYRSVEYYIDTRIDGIVLTRLRSIKLAGEGGEKKLHSLFYEIIA